MARVVVLEKRGKNIPGCRTLQKYSWEGVCLMCVEGEPTTRRAGRRVILKVPLCAPPTTVPPSSLYEPFILNHYTRSFTSNHPGYTYVLLYFAPCLLHIQTSSYPRHAAALNSPTPDIPTRTLPPQTDFRHLRVGALARICIFRGGMKRTGNNRLLRETNSAATSLHVSY